MTDWRERAAAHLRALSAAVQAAREFRAVLAGLGGNPPGTSGWWREYGFARDRFDAAMAAARDYAGRGNAEWAADHGCLKV